MTHYLDRHLLRRKLGDIQRKPIAISPKGEQSTVSPKLFRKLYIYELALSDTIIRGQPLQVLLLTAPKSDRDEMAAPLNSAVEVCEANIAGKLVCALKDGIGGVDEKMVLNKLDGVGLKERDQFFGDRRLACSWKGIDVDDGTTFQHLSEAYLKLYWDTAPCHHLLSLSLNGKLHLAPLKDDIKKVVDIGTGTGIWAISSEIEDCTQEWTFDPESFDYVHMRYLYGSISDWSALFKEAFRVCKPGGWVESYEASPRMESDDGSVTETCAINEWGKFFIEGGKKLNRTFEILDKDLQKKGMEEAGFVDVQTWDFKAPIGGWAGDPRLKEIGQFAQAALEQDYEGYVLFMANMVLGWSKEEVSTYCAQLRREIRSGRFHPFYRQRVVYGRKPE
ncbi:hypothetical protein CDV36_014827 [Fusarium kuroshium]|uniref:Methyltransferase type 11 domain-containing protein n=1 Tax=Fusarium kuroshium TaxID=2010991 RepID=A0A3M2REA2_9HYPO|nr:hypothetical protein CDV36_014827 [Fusarium kuroshium]